MKKVKTDSFFKYRFIISFFTAFTILLSIASCSKKINEPTVFSNTEVLVFQNGEYVKGITDKNPEPTQGIDQFYKDMYSDIRYPASARKNNIQGTIMFEIEIDKNGKVENIKSLNSLSTDCDTEARKAIERGCRLGFKPFIFNGNQVRIKFLVPVNFRLNG